VYSHGSLRNSMLSQYRNYFLGFCQQKEFIYLGKVFKYRLVA